MITESALGRSWSMACRRGLAKDAGRIAYPMSLAGNTSLASPRPSRPGMARRVRTFDAYSSLPRRRLPPAPPRHSRPADPAPRRPPLVRLPGLGRVEVRSADLAGHAVRVQHQGVDVLAPHRLDHSLLCPNRPPVNLPPPVPEALDRAGRIGCASTRARRCPSARIDSGDR